MLLRTVRGRVSITRSHMSLLLTYRREGLPIPEAINTVPYCKPAEIAGLVSYLVSEEAGFVTGMLGSAAFELGIKFLFYRPKRIHQWWIVL